VENSIEWTGGGGGGGGEVKVAGVELRVVHFVRWCRRNQPRKYCPPLTRTNIKHTNTSWIRFLRSIQKVVFIRQAQNGLKRSDASTAALKLFGQLDESWAQQRFLCGSHGERLVVIKEFV
jgi:hypothetical protein